MLAGVEAVEGRAQQPPLVHDAVDDVEVDGGQHLAVVAEGPVEAVLVDDQLHPLRVELADGDDLDAVEAGEGGVMGAAGAAAGADESCFQHGWVLGGWDSRFASSAIWARSYWNGETSNRLSAEMN